MKKAFLIIAICMLAAGRAEANKELDSLFKAEVQIFRTSISEKFKDEKPDIKFKIIGTYSAKKYNEKYNKAFIKALKNLLKDSGFSISTDEYPIDIPNLNDQLDKLKRNIQIYQKYDLKKLYYLILSLEYYERILQIKLLIFDPESNQTIDAGTTDIEINKLKSIDSKSWIKTKYNSYLEIPDEKYFFSLELKNKPFSKYTNEDSRYLHLPEDKYTIRFRDALGFKNKYRLELAKSDSLRIQIMKIHKPPIKLQTIKYVNFIFPGTAIGLFPGIFTGSPDEWIYKSLYAMHTILFYVNLYHVCNEENFPSHQKFLSEKARKKYRNTYNKDIAMTCGLYALNIAYGYLFYNLYFDDHIVLEPQIINLTEINSHGDLSRQGILGINLKIYIDQ